MQQYVIQISLTAFYHLFVKISWFVILITITRFCYLYCFSSNYHDLQLTPKMSLKNRQPPKINPQHLSATVLVLSQQKEPNISKYGTFPKITRLRSLVISHQLVPSPRNNPRQPLGYPLQSCRPGKSTHPQHEKNRKWPIRPSRTPTQKNFNYFHVIFLLYLFCYPFSTLSLLIDTFLPNIFEDASTYLVCKKVDSS